MRENTDNMRGLVYLVFFFGFMSMLSCEKLEKVIGQETYFLPTQKSILFKNRSNVGQYNFTIEVDTMSSSFGILFLEWGNAMQKMALKFTNPSNKLEYTITTEQDKFTERIGLRKVDHQDKYRLHIAHGKSGLEIYFNGELLHHQESGIVTLGYLNYNTFSTYNVTYFSTKY